MPTEHTRYEIFVSYSRQNNALPPDAPAGAKGWVTALRDHILADHRRFSTEPLRIFLDHDAIRDMDDWRHRILGALRHSKILLVCLSPAYFRSDYCRWEWEEYQRRRVHQLLGAESIAAVYFVEVPGSSEQETARWLDSVTRGNFTDVRPWFPEGAEALQREEVRRRLAKLGESLWERIERARRAERVPGNLRWQTPYFVGRHEELRSLHEQLTKGAIGLVTAVHGLGGQGKTELAVAYAHGWADSYPAGLWALGAEGKKELLPLIGELAFAPELGYRPTEAERADPVLLGRAVLAELERRALAARERDPDGGAAALLLLDNVSDPELLSPPQLATLPRADWLRIVATTRLGRGQLRGSPKSLAFVEVESLAEDDALALVREHQPDQRFASPAEEAAAREIARELGGFTLAVEQVAIHLGLHPEIAPSAFLDGLRRKGLPSADALGARPDVQAQMLHQQKQLGLILDATLGLLDGPARTALRFAALLPADSVPWPWLKALVVGRHPEIAQFAPDEPDPWIAARRRLEGLHLLTPGDHPELARLHRLVAAHLISGPSLRDGNLRRDAAEENPPRRGGPLPNPEEERRDEEEVEAHAAARAWAISESQAAPEPWELDALLLALPPRLSSDAASQDLANATVFLSDKVLPYRNLPATMGLLRAAHGLLERRANDDPSDLARQRDLSVSHNKIGDVLREQGDLGGELDAYRAALTIRERLAAADPDNATLQRDLAVSHQKIGDVLVEQGDSAGALAAFRASMTIDERLARFDIEDAWRQRNLCVSHDRIGAVLAAQGDLAGALAAFRASMAMAERLAHANPDNATWQSGLSVCHEKIGDVLVAQGDLAGALDPFRAAMAIRERLAGADPDNATWQRDLSVSHNKIGDVRVAQGDLAGALEAYRASMVIRERLADADPDNATWQRDLSLSHERIGNLLRTQGDLAGAFEAYRAAAAIHQRLADADPDNATWQRDLSVSHNKVGNVRVAQGDLAGALDAFHSAVSIAQRLAGADPAHAGWQRDLWLSCCKMADVLERSGKSEAGNWWRRAFEVLDGMKRRGLFVSPADERVLDQLRQKVGGG